MADWATEIKAKDDNEIQAWESDDSNEEADSDVLANLPRTTLETRYSEESATGSIPTTALKTRYESKEHCNSGGLPPAQLRSLPQSKVKPNRNEESIDKENNNAKKPQGIPVSSLVSCNRTKVERIPDSQLRGIPASTLTSLKPVAPSNATRTFVGPNQNLPQSSYCSLPSSSLITRYDQGSVAPLSSRGRGRGTRGP
eukprot:TRINITY_DN14387_c1_g1_i1.p1 TRINITY_DN14387_c1_g1~~TRINITY_DN14387_c1_g1_i1.p1  ORF type:complete len:198 (+),score=17.91 TRINITY_DN14387_c1_g1_i1:50-643(+)